METHEEVPHGDQKLWRHAMLVVAASVALRLIIAGITPLFPDETYYWEWSRRLAAGYFDHPPAVAYAIRLGTAMFGDNPFGVRFGSVVAGGFAAYVICATAWRLQGERASLIAAVVFAVMPLAAAGLVIALFVFFPVITWNARHEWASFRFQLQHGFGSGVGSVIRREGEFIGGQLGVASPILLVMMVVAIAAACRRGASATSTLLAS